MNLLLIPAAVYSLLFSEVAGRSPRKTVRLHWSCPPPAPEPMTKRQRRRARGRAKQSRHPMRS